MRIVRTLSIIVGLALPGVMAFSPTASGDLAPPTSTTAKSGPAVAGGGYPVVAGVRYAAHPGFDRVVFDFRGGTPAWRVGYGTLTGDGSGEPIPVAGNATLVVYFSGAAAHDGDYVFNLKNTYDANLAMLRQVKFGTDYEGYVSFGLGLRDRVGFRVTTLTGPPRVVVDVAHQPSTPFTVAPVTKTGTAANVVVDGIRAGAHPGYDRLVFDVRGTAKPTVTVRYAADTSLLLVKLTALGTSTSAPHASYGGPSPIDYGYRGLRRVRLASAGGGVLVFRVATAQRHGFRVMTLTSPTRSEEQPSDLQSRLLKSYSVFC
jgi:hypothetical protein